MQTLLQDLRFAIRILAKAPGFTAVVVISLALGIGVNTTIFSLINGVLFRPLPRVKEPAALVWFRAPASYPDYEDFRDQNDVFSGISALSGTSEFSLSQGGQPELVKGEFVSANYFSVLGVDISTGRAFLPEEDRIAEAQPVVVLSYGLWQRRFGGDPNLIGGSVSLNGLTFTVIGVAPQGFVGAEAPLPRDLWAPMAIYPRLNPPPAGKGDVVPNRLRDRGTYSLLAGLVFGLAPALQASKPDPIPALKNETAGKGYRRSRLRNAFVISQTALSVILLIGSGLFIRSLQNARTIDPGFKVEGALLATLDPGLLRYSKEQGRSFFARRSNASKPCPASRARALWILSRSVSALRNTMFMLKGRMARARRRPDSTSCRRVIFRLWVFG